MQAGTRRRTLADMTREELDANFAATVCTEEEMDLAYPEIFEARARVEAAVKELQAKGILDANGELIRPEELPLDCRPESETECC